MTEPNVLLQKIYDSDVNIFRWYSENENLNVFFTESNFNNKTLEKLKTMFVDIIILKAYQCIVIDMSKQNLIGYNPVKYYHPKNKAEATTRLRLYNTEVSEGLSNFRL